MSGASKRPRARRMGQAGEGTRAVARSHRARSHSARDLCNAYGLWVESIEATNKYGVMVKSPRGFPTQSPCIALTNRQAEIMLRIASEFGFTPASRSRIRAVTEGEELDLFSVENEH